jgi:hypothetical protein
MKLNYFPETDLLYIDLSEPTSTESREVSEGVMLDYDVRFSDWSAGTVEPKPIQRTAGEAVSTR